MATDPLDQVLRLVADGRLSAEEAGPILAALEEAGLTGDARLEDPRPDPAPDGSRPRALRIEVRDNGRNVVNLRLPIAVGRFALDRVPGLSGDQVDRVREAMNTGFRGPVLVVDDGDSGVRIVLD
jgi:hypothetical protein